MKLSIYKFKNFSLVSMRFIFLNMVNKFLTKMMLAHLAMQPQLVYTKK